MAPQVIDDLVAEVMKVRGTVNSAVAVITGISARIQAAVDAALANGATAEQLAPVTQVITDLETANSDLAAAVAANP